MGSHDVISRFCGFTLGNEELLHERYEFRNRSCSRYQLIFVVHRFFSYRLIYRSDRHRTFITHHLFNMSCLLLVSLPFLWKSKKGWKRPYLWLRWLLISCVVWIWILSFRFKRLFPAASGILSWLTPPFWHLCLVSFRNLCVSSPLNSWIDWFFFPERIIYIRIISFHCFVSIGRGFKPACFLRFFHSRHDCHNFAQRRNFCNLNFAANFLSVYRPSYRFLSISHSRVFGFLLTEIFLARNKLCAPLTFLFTSCF